MQFKFRPSVQQLDARDLPSANPLDPPTPPPANPSWWTNSAGPMTPEELTAYNTYMMSIGSPSGSTGAPPTNYTSPYTPTTQQTGSTAPAWNSLDNPAYAAAYTAYMMSSASNPGDSLGGSDDEVEITITGVPQSGKDFAPKLVAAAKTEPGAKYIVEEILKVKTGVDIATDEQQKKWAAEKVIYGVVKEKDAVVSGGVLNAIQFSVQNFEKAPQKDKAMIIQLHHTTISFYDADGKKIVGQNIDETIIEGFAVDGKGVMTGFDFHGYTAQIGTKLGDKTVASVQCTTDWIVGWGIYAGKAPPQSGVFYQGKTSPEADPITWLGKTMQYESKYTLNSKGEWFFIDDSTNAMVQGTGNMIMK